MKVFREGQKLLCVKLRTPSDRWFYPNIGSKWECVCPSSYDDLIATRSEDGRRASWPKDAFISYPDEIDRGKK